MCGIVGIFNYKTGKQPAIETVLRMLTQIKHRGPDECGIFLAEKICMGNVRLSILDLVTGQQPIANSDKSLWIVFNGEIFNYLEIREELEKKNHVFQTKSDTEVIVHLYEEYGPGCLEKLNGQFAIAIWDNRKEELLLARDRVGIRPLFYCKTRNTFLFGSEIKALLEYPDIELEFSPFALSQIFTFWTTLTPNTAFKDVYELPPGHYMIVRHSGLKVIKYWQLSFPPENSVENFTLERAMEEFHSLFYDAVRIRLRADVPVGAYLSGGIDSSATTSYINEIFPNILRTFSIGFTGKDYDETYYQDLAVKSLRTEHTAFRCTPQDIAEKFPDVVWYSEIPLLRTAPVPMFYLSRVVRENNFKVVITGEGADEILGGYNIFKESAIRRFWAKDPQSKLRPMLLTKLYPYLPHLKDANSNILKFFFGYKLLETNSPFYSHLLRWHNTSRIKNHFSNQFAEEIKGYDPLNNLEKELPENFEKMHPLSMAQWIELTIFMSGYLLSSQGDRMAMANSVEGRYPFLDHRIIEFCSKLPPGYKLHGLNEKFLLKRLMKDRLPDPVVKRPKQAYRAPIFESFISDAAPGYIAEVLDNDYIMTTGIFNPESVKKLLTKMKTGNQVSEIENMTLTAIISTHLLYDKFILNPNKVGKNAVLKSCRIEYGL